MYLKYNIGARGNPRPDRGMLQKHSHLAMMPTSWLLGRTIVARKNITTLACIVHFWSLRRITTGCVVVYRKATLSARYWILCSSIRDASLNALEFNLHREIQPVWSIIHPIQTHACGWFGCANWESQMLWMLLKNNINGLNAPINISK